MALEAGWVVGGAGWSWIIGGSGARGEQVGLEAGGWMVGGAGWSWIVGGSGALGACRWHWRLAG